MTMLLLLLAGLPVGVLVYQAVARLAWRAEDAEDRDPVVGRRRLPWQTGPWPDRIRWAAAASAPVLMGLAGWRFEALQAVAVSALLVALLICTATDLLSYRVPNLVTYPAIALALLAATVMPGADTTGAAAAALLAGGAFLVLAILTRGGIGLGDAKLAALIGAALGLPAAYQAILLGVLSAGAIMAVLLLIGLVGRRQALPYAPFLAMAAIAVVLLRGAAFAPL
jgi:prepilin signal peptidase PulO-like enzyme (type II secretory pathway)